jgi:hypothetical protein
LWEKAACNGRSIWTNKSIAKTLCRIHYYLDILFYYFADESLQSNYNAEISFHGFVIGCYNLTCNLIDHHRKYDFFRY